MKRTGLRRAVSGVLSVAMTASALFSDFTVPETIFAADDTSSVETTLDGYSDSDGSITSEYIVENLDEDLGEEAAALNEDAAYMVAEEYLVSELTEVSEDTDAVSDASDETTDDADVETTETETVTETDDMLTESIGASTNDADAVSTSSNDVGSATLSLDDEAETVSVGETEETADTEETTETEVTVSEEEVAEVAEVIIDTSNDITAADDYDTNGLAPTYHYITLNYSLVDEDMIWDGITTADIWDEVPDAFIAAYLTSVNVYTLEGNEDYYVAFIDPASINGLGSAIYADFTDLDTENPTVYNDIITFDTETGLVYIPKSFYYDENGNETIKGLEAQVLVPYSFDTTNSDVAVSVTSEIDGVEGISGTSSVPTLDITMTLQIVDAEDADKISLDDISLTVNDDMLPLDTSGENAYYDTETGELTIAVSPNYVYSVNVTISENISEEMLAYVEQKEILVASTGDLSDILVADSYYSGEANKVDTASDMMDLSNKGVTVELEEGKIVAGQTMTYHAIWAVLTSEQTTVSSSTMTEIINNTATYSYYAQNSTGGVVEVTDSNWNQFFDSSGNISLPGTSTAYYLLRAIDKNNKSSTYNRITTLPNNTSLKSTSYGNSTSTTKWTTNISGNPSGYEQYVAIHCVENGEGTATGDVYGDSDVTMRVLYSYEDSNGDGYFVFALRIPKSWSQSGCGVYKVSYTSTDETEYTAKFGVNKVASEDNSDWLGAIFTYGVYKETSDAGIVAQINRINGYVQNYEDGDITLVDLKKTCSTAGLDLYTSNETDNSNITLASLDSSNCSILKNYDESTDDYIYVYIGEIVAPSGYERKEGLWVLTIRPGKTVNGVKQSDSTLVSAVYYTWDGVASATPAPSSSKSETLYGDGFSFITDNESTTIYGAFNLTKVDVGNTSTYVPGAVYMLFDYAGYGSDYIDDLIDAAATANATGSAETAIVSFYNSLGIYKDYAEGVYVTSGSSSVSATLQSFNTTTGARTGNTVIDFGSSSTKAVCLIEIYSPDDYILDDNMYCFVLNANNNKSDTYTTAVKQTTITSDLGTQYGTSTLSAAGVTYTGNNKTSALTLKFPEYPYTSHTAVKDLTGTVTNELVKYVVVQLYRSTDGGTTYSATQYTATLSDDNDWTYKWEKLPKYTSSGVEYKYKAVELQVVMYSQFDTGKTLSSVSSANLETVFTVESTTADGQTTITNEIDIIDVPVKKDFYDTTASERIKSVVFELYRNNVATGETIKLSTGNWSGEFEDLVKYDTSGNEYSYTVKEISVTYEDMWKVEHTVTKESVIETLFNPTITTASDGTITVMNYFFTTTRYAVKVFGNDETSRLIRITTVLYADGKSMESLDMTTTLSDDNNWTSVNSKWTGLDFYDYTGSQITYTISETSATYVDSLGDEYTVDGSTLVKLFEPEYDSDGKTVTNYYKTVTYTIEKELSGTLANTLIKSVTVRLYRNDVATDKTYTLNSTKGWSYTWEGLDRYDSSGNEYEYTVKEETVVMNDQFFTGTSYTISETNLNKVFNISTTTSDGQTTITNTIPPTYLNVEKKFDTYTEGRVTAVVVELYRNDEATGEKITLSDSNNWASSFTDLVKYDENGDAYSYKAVEVSVTYKDMWGKSRTVDDRDIIKTIFEVTEVTSGNKTTVTNKLNTTTHTVVKTMGSETTESIVYSVTARLYADGVSAYSVFGDRVLSDDNNWTDTWNGYNASGKWVGLDKYDYQGNEIKYTSKEVSVDVMDQYDTKVISTVKDALNTVFTVITSTKNGTTTVDNTVITRPLNVKKVFGNNDTKDRVSQVIVTLYRNGKAMPDTLTLDANNNWSGTFENLVKYDPDGNEYVYTAVETSVTYTDMWGKEHKVDDRSIITKLFTVTEITSGETTTVTNTFNTVDHDVSKQLNSTLTKSLVKSVTTELFADGASLESVFGNIVLSSSNSWSGTWEGLDEYDYKGNLITYTVNEIEVTMADQFHTATVNTVKESNVNTVFDVDIDELAGETQIGDTVFTTPLYVEKQFGVNTVATHAV